MGISRKPTPLLSLRNLVLALTFAHLLRNLQHFLRNQVTLRFLLGLETRKSNHLFRHGGEIFANAIAAHKCQYVFTTLEESHPLLDSCRNLKMRVFTFPSIQGAIYAADIVFRTTKIPAVVFIPNTREGLGALAALQSCKNSHSGAVVISESPLFLLAGRGHEAEVNQAQLLEPACKASWQISTVRQIVGTLEASFQRACEDIPGPVFLEVYRDVLFSQEEAMHEYLSLTHGTNSLFARFHLARIYATNSSFVRPAQPLKVHKASPSQFLVSKTVRLLCRSRRPLLILGSQVVPAHIDTGAVQSALVTLGIPVFLFGDSKGLLGHESPLVNHRGLPQALQMCDLAIFLGIAHDQALGFGELVPDGSFAISVNRSKLEIMLNRRPNLSILADPSMFICEMSKRFALKNSMEWMKDLQGLSATPPAFESPRDRAVAEVLRALNTVAKSCHLVFHCPPLPANMKAPQVPQVPVPTSELTPGVFFHPHFPVGWLEPPFFTSSPEALVAYALASKVTLPERNIWIVDATESLGRRAEDLKVLSQHRVHVVVVVLRRSEEREPRASHFPSFASVKIASPEECTLQLQEAQRLLLAGKSVLVDCPYHD